MSDEMDRANRQTVRKAPERAASEYALLGLIAQTAEGEIHGYDLSRSFAEGALGRIIRLEPGMLYHYLKKLARDGYITSRVERQSGRPDRQVHTLTAEGDALLRAWIASPVRSTREIRLEFLVKLYLARAIDPRHAVTLVTGQRSVMRARGARLTEQVATPPPPDADNAFGESVLRLRLSQTEAALAWLDTLPESRLAVDETTGGPR
ncbi:MAG: PadR family transcriptional regulator [Chloroflexota bacterium]|nr:PadR family transcriptional regulator [Chloroflexota bacterium]